MRQLIPVAAGMALLAPLTGALAQAVPPIPLQTGLTIVSALRFPEGDRENLVLVTDASSAGARYTWRYKQDDRSGEFSRFVRATDLAGAPRLDQVFLSSGPEESPGFTAFSISNAVYRRLHTDPTVPFTVTSIEGGGSLRQLGRFGALMAFRITMRGTLALVSRKPEPMPVLVNGNRVNIPTLHLAGKFAFQGTTADTDLWIVADSTHPLILKVVSGTDILQTIRIDFPNSDQSVEKALTTTCRAELPGLYFDFNSATLDPASEPVLAGVAKLLQKHGDWTIAIEGHTDSIGGAASNQALSARRANAVRAGLTARQVAPQRLQSSGFGQTRPRESNATLEGRARNRRVELVRPCKGGSQ